MERIKRILEIFQDTIKNIESLSDFYNRSDQTLVIYKQELENEYVYARNINDALNALFDIDSYKERNKKLKVINRIIIDDKNKLSDVCEVVPFEKDNQNFISYSMNNELLDIEKYDPNNAVKIIEQIKQYEYILDESVLSHIVVSFENFLSNIYRYLICNNPNMYLAGQTVLLTDLLQNNFPETFAEKIENEVTSKMYDSLSTLKMISEKEKISVEKYKNTISSFAEIYYRRNAYVHTSGRANKDYLDKVDKSFSKNLKIDDKLFCDKDYLIKSIYTLNQLIFAITFELLAKENASSNAIMVLGNYYFDKLKKGDYELTKYVYKEMSKYKGITFADRLMYRINYIISVKHLGENKLVNRELETLDVSAAEMQFKIAKECLNENYEKVYNMLSESYPESFPAIAIRDWPIFIEFRETEYYKKFIELHQEDFRIQQIEDSNLELDDLLVNEEKNIG